MFAAIVPFVAWSAWLPIQPLGTDETAVKWTVTERIRYENKQNFLFGSAGPANDDDFYLVQVRFGFDFPVGAWHGHVEGQSAHALGSAAISVDATPNIFEDRFDLHQAFVEGEGVRIGRQKLSYGQQRLVGAFEWSNTARVFDAAKVTLPMGGAALDFFAAKPIAVRPANFNDWSKSGTRAFDSELYGAVFRNQTSAGKTRYEAYYLVRHSSDFDDTVHTVGAYAEGSLSSWSWDAEGAYQFGDFGGMTHRAYAASVGARAKVAQPMTIRGRFNVASGDGDPSDTTHETFDNLYPTNHLHYGQMDLFAWMNQVSAEIGASWKLCPRATLDASYHWFWLMEPETDAWYNAGGGIVRPGAPGADRFVGGELDLRLDFKPDDGTSLSMGYSQFFPGSFVSFTGSDREAQFFYAMGQWKFGSK